jgi:sortase (surface protein transpeptidase)
MPTAPRSMRSLLALALVVNLIAASAPATALGTQHQAIVPIALEGRASSTPVPADRAEWLSTALTPSPRPTSIRTFASLPGWISRPKPSTPEPKPTAVSKQKASTGSAKATSFKGRNHLWIPALRINRSITWYACSSSYYPGNRVYRWGCAGKNNVYLFGHAHSVFKPLHDAYVRGRLKKGMKAYYAGADGKVRTYAVSWWKVTTPEKGAWAYAGQSSASMTLQTCVGAKSQYRLIVRLRLVS